MQFLIGFLLTSLFASVTFAQMNTTKTWEVSGSYGPIISSTVEGVTEIIPTYGIKVAKGMSYYRPEVFYHTGKSTENPYNQIEYHLMGVSMKNQFRFDALDEMPEMTPFVLVGLQYSNYETTTVGKKEGNGFHLGMGIDYDIAGGFQFTTDFFYCNGPGRLLLINLGLQYVFGGEKKDGN